MCLHNMFRILRGHCSEYGLLADYCDVAMYKPHSLFSADSEIPPFEIMARIMMMLRCAIL